MSVNIYNPELDELLSLTSVFASPVIIDVKELPTIGIENAIYRVASDSWSFKSIELSAVDMTVNTASFESLGCTTSIDGNIYTYTPNTNYIRYWSNNEVCSVSSINVDSSTGEMTIYGADSSTILTQTMIETGSLYPFYISQKWASVNVTLSHTNMSANTTALTNAGFDCMTSAINYIYKPKNCRFKYNNSLVSKIIITIADGNMEIYDDSDAIIYNQIIVDGIYNFLKASAVTYWAGNKQSNKLDQLVTVNDIGSTEISGIVIKYVTTLPSSGIEDIIYGYDSISDYDEEAIDGFLDDDPNFVKNNNIYTPNNVSIKASIDGSEYKDFASLEYDGVNTQFVLTYSDDTTDIIPEGDTFYWEVTTRNYFAGNASEQSLTLLAGAGGGGSAYIPGEGISINGSVISLKPATASTLGGVKPDDETLKVDAEGTLSGNYAGGFNVKIDGHTISTKTFVGTLEEWNNLTSAQKAKFDTVSITDDGTTPIATPGHEVLDSTDTPLPQRTNIQFEGAEATDDSTNDITKVTITPYTAGDGIEIDDHEIGVTEDRPATFVGTTQEWDALTPAEKAQYKIVNLTNDIAGGEMVVVDTVEENNFNPITSNAVYDFPIDSITNNSLRPATSNAVRDAIYFLEDSLKYRHIDGTAISPMTLDPSLYYNANSLTMYFSLAAGDYTCNQLYNGNYYARLASFTTSDVNIAFPGATNVAVGSVIMVGRCISNRSDGVYGISLYRYNTSTWYLTSSRLYSSTSGTKVTISATEYLYCPFYGKTSYFGFPEI